MKRRLRCYLAGCQLGDEGGYETTCWRCDADAYSREFIQLDLWRRIIPPRWLSAWWQLYFAVHNRCGYCGKHLWFQSYGSCDKKCEDAWIPF